MLKVIIFRKSCKLIISYAGDLENWELVWHFYVCYNFFITKTNQFQD